MGLRMDDIHAPTVASGPTSRPTANGTTPKLTFSEVAAQKDNIEAELRALGSVLDSHGVNMTTSLTTFDGYPRADIDVAQIRTTRARIIHLKTDYKSVMARLEEAMHEHFASKQAPPMDSLATNSTTQRGTTLDPESGNPPVANSSSATRAPAVEPAFAKVNTVAANSPAETAGLRPGDEVLRFGTANWTNHERLSKVAQVVQQNENRPIAVKISREAGSGGASSPEVLSLSLIPRRDWGGRGLLGCHLLPL